MMIGETKGHLGQSALLAEAFGQELGDAPPVDLAAERRHGDFLRANRELVTLASDLSDGGLALAAFEMAEAAGIGLAGGCGHRPLFGEDQARYLLACTDDQATALLAAATAAGVPPRGSAASPARISAWAIRRPRSPIFPRSTARPSPPPSPEAARGDPARPALRPRNIPGPRETCATGMPRLH